MFRLISVPHALSHVGGWRQGAAQHRAVMLALLVWAVLWGVSVWLDPQWLAIWGLALNAHGHTHLYAHGHPFVDARMWWGMPNTLDVLSNLPLLGVGLWGLWRIPRVLPRTSRVRKPAMLAFVGLALTCFGSAVYHADPLPETLVLDRLGMAVTFAGVLGWAGAERWHAAWAFRGALVVLVVGAVASVLPLWTGHVLPWAVLQFGGLALVCGHAVMCLLARGVSLRLTRAWWALVGWYVLAKWFEMHDAQVFVWTHELVSGHTLKHLAAACALLPLLGAVADCCKMANQQASDRNAV